jgi:UDP:flavonoid glycosyltransferase YjiC (YdhE family)
MDARKRFLALAPAGAGGDLHPLLAVVHRLRERGHHLVVFSNRDVASAIAAPGVETVACQPEHDLGPKFVAARNATLALPPEARGQEVGRRLAAWAEEVAPAVEQIVTTHRLDAMLTSLFGGMLTKLAAESAHLPWIAVNSTFFVGDARPPTEEDFGTRTRIVFRDFLRVNTELR